jgi:site-specific DNA recombinase
MSVKRAATYLRMSTDEQENSPERQRNQILPYCERKGYRVVKQYEDLGLRGHDDSRPQFQKLLADAKAGLFDVIVVDEQSRLARNDPVKFIANVIDPLRDASVVIDTVAKGILDWNDLGDFIVGAVGQHAANNEVVTLSRRVVTELARKALDANVVAGKPPYGYRLVWLDQAGKVVHVGKRTWTKRPAGWKPQFQVDEDQAEVVRFVFDAYVNRDVSLNGIMKELRARGVQSPRGGPYWSRAHLRNVLVNRAYVGDWVFNRQSVGSFHRLAWDRRGGSRTGLAEAKPARQKGAMKNAESDWVVVTNHHEPIVDREPFEKAAAALTDNRHRSTPSPSRGDYCFSKLLVCSHCGSWMVGDRDPSGKFYQCGGYARYGPDRCNPHRVRECDVMAVIEHELASHFLSPEMLDRLRADARTVKAKRDTGKDAARIKRELVTLGSKIQKGEENLLLLDPEFVTKAQAQLRSWEKDRGEKLAELARLEKEDPVGDVEKLIKYLERALWEYRDAVAADEPAAIRKAVRSVLVKMELRFGKIKKAVRHRYPLVGGISYVVSGEKFAFDVLTTNSQVVNNQSWLWSSSHLLELPFSLREMPGKDGVVS